MTREPCELNCDCDLCRVEAECLRLREQVAADHDTILALTRERDEAREIVGKTVTAWLEGDGWSLALSCALRDAAKAVGRWDGESDICFAESRTNG